MSPGFVALPPGMFSVAGTTPMTLSLRLELADRVHRRDHAGAAATCRTSSLPSRSGGLIEMPPVSNVMPLPTSASTSLLVGSPVYVMTMSVGGCHAPCETTEATSPCLLFAMRASSRIVDLDAGFLGEFDRRVGEDASASCRWPGVSASRRAKLTASPRIVPRSTPRFSAADRDRRRASRPRVDTTVLCRASSDRSSSRTSPAIAPSVRRSDAQRSRCLWLRREASIAMLATLRLPEVAHRGAGVAREHLRVRTSRVRPGRPASTRRYGWSFACRQRVSLSLPLISPTASTSAIAPSERRVDASAATPSRSRSVKTGTTSAPVAYGAGAS